MRILQRLQNFYACQRMRASVLPAKHCAFMPISVSNIITDIVIIIILILKSTSIALEFGRGRLSLLLPIESNPHGTVSCTFVTAYIDMYILDKYITPQER